MHTERKNHRSPFLTHTVEEKGVAAQGGHQIYGGGRPVQQASRINKNNRSISRGKPRIKNRTRPGLAFEMHLILIPASYKPSLKNARGERERERASPANLSNRNGVNEGPHNFCLKKKNSSLSKMH